MYRSSDCFRSARFISAAHHRWVTEQEISDWLCYRQRPLIKKKDNVCALCPKTVRFKLITSLFTIPSKLEMLFQSQILILEINSFSTTVSSPYLEHYTALCSSDVCFHSESTAVGFLNVWALHCTSSGKVNSLGNILCWLKVWSVPDVSRCGVFPLSFVAAM